MGSPSTNNPANLAFRLWGIFWGIVTLIATIYIGYESLDFIFHPDMTIQDPSQDVMFGYILAVLAVGFLVVTLANFSIIPWAGLPTAGYTFLAICLGLTTWHWFIEAHSTASYLWKAAIFCIGTVFPGLLVFRSMLHAKHDGRDPVAAAEDTIAQLSSRTWWQYLMYKNTRRQRR